MNNQSLRSTSSTASPRSETSAAISSKKADLSSRAAAVLVVQECIESGRSLSAVLPHYLDKLKDIQRPLTQEISFGVLRWYYRLNPLLKTMLRKPLRGKKRVLHYVLLVGLYQLNYLDKAAYAVVKETVNSCDELQLCWAKGLVNAILRRFIREKEMLLRILDSSWDCLYAYPEWLVNDIKSSWKEVVKQLPDLSIEAILEAGNQRPPMTLRINRQQNLNAYKMKLAELDIGFFDYAVKDQTSLVLDKPVSVEKLPLFTIGGSSVQDGAAQLAASLLAPEAGDRILDACAAPGGKTMHLYEQQPLLEKIIALDISAQRLERVIENSHRLNVPAEKIEIMAADASQSDWWDGQLFDRILMDAPCSATGVIRRHPDIKVLRRAEDIAALTTLQARIINNLWSMLKPGGLLLYATCSILRAENDQQMLNFLSNKQHHRAEEVLIEAEWGHKMPIGRQIFPGEHNMDGFYYAVLKKQES